MSGYTELAKMENSRSCLRRIARHDEQQFSKDSIVNVMEKFVKTVNVMDETILVPCRLMDRQVGDSTDIVQAPTKNSTSNQLTLNTFNANGKTRKQSSKNIHEFLNSAELFNLYTTLNSLKNDLLWNRSDADDEEDEGIAHSITAQVEDNSSNVNSTELSASSSNSGSTNSLSSPATTLSTSSSSTSTGSTVKGHVRRPSTASMTSTTSVSNLSDSESEISNENDSGIESEGNCGNSQKGEHQSKAANVDKATDLARQCRRHLSGLYQCLEQMTEAAHYLTARYQNDIGPV